MVLCESVPPRSIDLVFLVFLVIIVFLVFLFRHHDGLDFALLRPVHSIEQNVHCPIPCLTKDLHSPENRTGSKDGQDALKIFSLSLRKLFVVVQNCKYHTSGELN